MTIDSEGRDPLTALLILIYKLKLSFLSYSQRDRATMSSTKPSNMRDPDPENPHPGPVTPLEPPNMDAILRSKRKWNHSLAHLELPLSRKWHMILTGTSIVLSAVQANGVYSWPT
jgi:hypothetical protein